MDAIQVLLQKAIEKHGLGIAMVIVDALARAHVTHIEATPQGVFAKLHYDKYARNSCKSRAGRTGAQSSSRSTCVGSGSSAADVSDYETQINRATFLSHKPRSVDAITPPHGFRMETADTLNAVCSIVPALELEVDAIAHCNGDEFYSIETTHSSTQTSDSDAKDSVNQIMDELLVLQQKIDGATSGLVLLANKELQDLQVRQKLNMENGCENEEQTDFVKRHDNEMQTDTVAESKSMKADASVQTTEALGETLEMKHRQLDAFFKRALDDCNYVTCEVREAISRTEIIIKSYNSRKVLGERGIRIRELAVQLRQHFEIPLQLSFELFVERC